MGPNLVHYILLIAALLCFFGAFLRWKEGSPQAVSIGWLGWCFIVIDWLVFGASVTR